MLVVVVDSVIRVHELMNSVRFVRNILCCLNMLLSVFDVMIIVVLMSE